MNAVIHLVFKDSYENDNFLKNLDIFDFTHTHFIITDIKNLNKTVYSNIEQIFYFNQKKECFLYLKNILSFLKEVGYVNAKICNSNNLLQTNSLDSIDELNSKLAIINDIIEI